MKGRFLSLSRDIKGVWCVSFSLDPSSVGEARRLFDREKGELNISVKEWKEKRSLSANAYFHLLVNRLAGALKISNDDCKKWLVRSYGTIAERNSFPVMITLPKGVDPDDFYPYTEWIYGDESRDTYQLFKQTHALNTKEFSRLLDGTIEECKQQGIETLSEDDLRRLYAQADKSLSNQQRDKNEGVGA